MAAAVELPRRLAAEALGSAMLLATVVGSGIMAERLSAGNVAVALLANALATGAVLPVLILGLGPLSGAHFNPAVTLVERSRGALGSSQALAYVGAQLLGALFGVACAHAMFELPMFTASTHARTGAAQLFSEAVATFGLIGAIWSIGRHRPDAVPYAVGAYIIAAYWFTASTSFANPAVTLARALTDTFAGIRPVDAPGFILAQLLGAGAARWLFGWLVPDLPLATESSR